MTRAFDDAGRLITITDWLHNATAYHYDPNSNNDQVTYANGTLGTIGYDHADRLMSINDTKSGTSFLQLTYSCVGDRRSRRYMRFCMVGASSER